MLYSPRQMEIATLCAIYMLPTNYKRLEKPKYALYAILIGSIILILFMLGAFHPLSQKIPQAFYQAIPVMILWGICKKYHISKEDIIEDQRYIFRSNWTVFFVSIIGLILSIILIAFLGFFIYGVLGVPITLDISHLPE